MRNISEQVLKQNRVELMLAEQDDDNDFSDKFKISLIDDSKFDDATIDAKCDEEHHKNHAESI